MSAAHKARGTMPPGKIAWTVGQKWSNRRIGPTSVRSIGPRRNFAAGVNLANRFEALDVQFCRYFASPVALRFVGAGFVGCTTGYNQPRT